MLLNDKNIFFDNRLKWFQYQIIMGTLKTNRIISKFVPNISSMCSFCGVEIETISHLFYDCRIVRTFLVQMYDYFATIWRDIGNVPAKKDLLFGNRNEMIFSTSNLLCLYVKYYIWKTRCSGKNLSFNSCLSWMRLELHITRLV